jgi:hypothetical protein
MAKPPKKKKVRAEKPSPMRWEFDPDIPTDDFFGEGRLSDLLNLQEAVENFAYMVEKKDFLNWEAVVCLEQDLPLTAQLQAVLNALISFSNTPDDRILYINEIARPSEPWYVILNRLAPHLLIEPFRMFDSHEDVKVDGWPRIARALEEDGQGLSLPPGVSRHQEVVPADLRHKLWLQQCSNALDGLGQEADMTLEDPEEHWRIEDFTDHLRECKESVTHFGLTLESLLTRVILPERDRPILIELMQEKLGLPSVQEPIADRL